MSPAIALVTFILYIASIRFILKEFPVSLKACQADYINAPRVSSCGFCHIAYPGLLIVVRHEL